MAKIESRKKQNPKLQQSELSDGRASLYLEYYLGRTETPVLDENGQQVYYTTGAMAGKPKYQIKHSRKKENLNLYIWLHPRSQQERVQNKNALALAEKIRFEREQTFLEDREGYHLRKEMDEDFLEFCKEFIRMPSLTKYTRITLKHGLQKFMDFLAATPRYALYKNNLKMTQLTVDMVAAYVEYLKENGTGDGPKIYFRMFKRMVTSAVDKDLIKKNPCRGFVLKNDNMTLPKEILLPEEIQQLVATHFEGQRTEIHRAFIFGLYTGVRWCDTSQMTYRNIDYSTKTLRFQQQKTKDHSSRSWVIVPLNDTIIRLIGEPDDDNYDGQVFKLPHYNICNLYLRDWVKRAGIKKKITWHCARHSFAVNVLTKGANIKTVSSLLGHTSIKMTENDMLPLKPGTKILLTGPTANSMRSLNGGWSYTWQGAETDRYAEKYNTVYEAMCNRFGTDNIIYVPTVTFRTKGNFEGEDVADFNVAKEAADHADIIMVCIGENSYCETPGNLTDLRLSENQRNLVKTLAETGKPLLFIINEGRPRIISDIEPLANSVVDIMLPGNMGGEALARLLAGDVNFSAKLPFTYPREINSLVTYDYKVSEEVGKMEGVYDYDARVNVQWPFGYGKSYTTYEYSNLRADKPNFTHSDILNFAVDIENTGKMGGIEPVLLFSADEVASVVPDNKRLRAFEAVPLKVGEKRTVKFSIPASDLAFVNTDGKWALKAGDFKIQVGNLQLTVICNDSYQLETPNI